MRQPHFADRLGRWSVVANHLLAGDCRLRHAADRGTPGEVGFDHHSVDEGRGRSAALGCRSEVVADVVDVRGRRSAVMAARGRRSEVVAGQDSDRGPEVQLFRGTEVHRLRETEA